MARKRHLFISGTLSSPLGGLTTDTSIQSAGLVNLPLVSAPDTLTLVLDSDGVSGTPEVVDITNHAAGSDLATIVRQRETATGGSAVRAHAINTKWVHAWTPADGDPANFPDASVTQAKVANLGSDLAAINTSLNLKAVDAEVVHLAGAETLTGVKTFAAGQFAAPVTNSQTTNSAGVAATLPRSDHQHAQPAATPRGVLSRAVVSASQGPITLEAALTNLAVGWTVETGRLYRVTASGKGRRDNTQGTSRVYLRDDPALYYGHVNFQSSVAAEAVSWQLEVWLSTLPELGGLTAGPVSLYLSGQQFTGANAWHLEVDATAKAYMTVEDMGLA